MPDVRLVKIFIASSAELEEERKECVMIINILNHNHPHLVLKPIEWEYNLAHSHYPINTNIQDAIYPLLKDTDLAVFLFHSRLGQHTLEEFEFVSAQKKRVFVYFKTGFTPPLNLIDPYKALLEFKNNLNEFILYKEYNDLKDFYGKFYPNLNLYLAENFSGPPSNTVNNTELTKANVTLIKMLSEQDAEIKKLNDLLNRLPSGETKAQLAELLLEKGEKRNELLHHAGARRRQDAKSLFFSYSHKDEGLRDELETHLKLLQRVGAISTWHDRKILPGGEWGNEIDHNLENAKIILLLISADFIASDYCWDTEVKRAMERHQSGEATVIPILLRPCDWKDTPFSKLQGLPRDMKAITLYKNRDFAWTEVTTGLRAIAYL